MPEIDAPLPHNGLHADSIDDLDDHNVSFGGQLCGAHPTSAPQGPGGQCHPCGHRSPHGDCICNAVLREELVDVFYLVIKLFIPYLFAVRGN